LNLLITKIYWILLKRYKLIRLIESIITFEISSIMLWWYKCQYYIVHLKYPLLCYGGTNANIISFIWNILCYAMVVWMPILYFSLTFPINCNTSVQLCTNKKPDMVLTCGMCQWSLFLSIYEWFLHRIWYASYIYLPFQLDQMFQIV
jgi:hypothetical protein